MKITTWNVNGIRSLKKSVPSILHDFESDIICLQETKVSRSQLPENIALIEGYASFFSYPRKQSGYSGVATYCKNMFMPDHAEEVLHVDHQFKIDEGALDVFGGFDDPTEMDFEGRVIVTQHFIKYKEEIQKLAVINVYCPRVDPDKPERHFYKMQFCHLLQSKMYEFCHQGCFVVIVGDLNIAYSMIDHCEPGNEEEFKSSEARQWLNSFLSININVGDETIKSVDAFRHFYPNRKEAYTCWNTKTGARLTNYGTRIDYVIMSSNLLPMLVKCEILSDYQGSDHCPVFAELKCDHVPGLKVEMPSICTRLWPEFSGNQQKLKTFFQRAQNVADIVTNHKKMKLEVSSKSKTSLKKNKQKSITSFFSTNISINQVSNTSVHSFPAVIDEADISDSIVKEHSKHINTCNSREQRVIDLNACSQTLSNNEEQSATENSKSNEWRSLLSGPPKPPLCNKHKKTCVLRTVKKDGANLGRQFFMCAQPSGPSSNPDANCNFFKWATAPKISTLKNGIK